MNYITVAENIFNWLSSFQIIERVVPAERKGETLTFQLNHPTEGIISVTEPIPEEPYFRSHGIGFKLNASGSEPVTLEVYDFGGIFDPIDQSIPGDHYATTHFALLGALLYQKNQDPEILKKIKMAMEFHIHTYRDAYYFGEWGYHWDFQNYAFLETFQLLKNNLSEEETRICETVIKESKENVNNPLTNWAAMRGYSAALRYGQFHNFMDKVKKWWWIQKVKQSFQRDGCSDDYRNLSRSIQYHVFTLALLHRIYLIDPNRKLKSMILKGVEYFIRFIDPEGCFNYVGRGQEQIFGYAAAIYILEAAILLDNKNGDHYEKQVLRIWNYLLRYQKKDGFFPLVLNCHSDKEKFGWYDYHHLTVYNAFLGVWLGFTDQLSTRETYPPIKDVLPEKIMMDYSEPTKTLKVLTSRYFAFFCGGAPEYLSEPSMTPQHIWFEDIGWVYSCPGGPSPDKFGRIHQIQNIEKNFFSPIAQLKNSQWILPAFKNPPQVHLKDHSVHMSLNYGPFTLTRYLEFKYDRIHFNDRLLFHNDDVLNEVRLFNFPVVIDKFDIHLKSNRSVDLISETGILNLQFHYLDFVSSEIELLETIETSKGLARVIVIRKNLFKPSKDLIQTISFSIQRD